MGVRIREADIDSDGRLIADALQRYLTPLADYQRFEWLYKRNPHGRVRAWLALDDDGTLVATAAAFPRVVYLRQERLHAWVLGDFCVNDRYRTLGPAVALQRVLLQAVSSEVPFCYDFPSRVMAAVYKRLQIEPVDQMVRMAKLLRTDGKIRQYCRNETLVRMISTVGNMLIKSGDLRSGTDATLKLTLQSNPCGPEFDELAERVGSRFGFCVDHSAEYLNWRYLENPYKKHEVVIAKRDGNLLGYAVISHNGEDAEVVDIFAEDSPSVLSGLIKEVVKIFRQRGAMRVNAEVLASHPWIGLFNTNGFYPREQKPLMVYVPDKPGVHGAGNDPLASRPWCVMGGDRDS